MEVLTLNSSSSLPLFLKFLKYLEVLNNYSEHWSVNHPIILSGRRKGEVLSKPEQDQIVV